MTENRFAKTRYVFFISSKKIMDSKGETTDSFRNRLFALSTHSKFDMNAYFMKIPLPVPRIWGTLHERGGFFLFKKACLPSTKERRYLDGGRGVRSIFKKSY